jgi:hypothetical protein
MIDSDLTDLLERAGGRTEVGAPPIDAMRAGATRRRRRRTAGVSLIGAAAVAAVIGGATLLTGPPRAGIPVATPTPTAAAVPEGMRLVGRGQVAIAVPAQWATNATRCGTAQKDTVVLENDATFCLSPRPAGVESVQLEHRAVPPEFRVDGKFEIDGVPAERQRTTCIARDAPQADVCTGMVNVPSLGVWFRAESSTNAAEVERILDRIQITPDQVGVPAIDGISGGQKYVDTLTAFGLKSTVHQKKTSSYPPGEVMSVSPAPGTMLSPGATVTVTLSAR